MSEIISAPIAGMLSVIFRNHEESCAPAYIKAVILCVIHEITRSPISHVAIMKKFHSYITCTTLFLLSLGVAVYAATSSTYYFKSFSTSGSISTWYTSDNSWGVNAPSGTGFVVMVTGEDWGTWSPVHTLPKKLNDVDPSHNTWFSQTASPVSGSGYDAWYDTFP